MYRDINLVKCCAIQKNDIKLISVAKEIVIKGLSKRKKLTAVRHWKLIDSKSRVLMALSFFRSSGGVMMVARVKPKWLSAEAESSIVTSLFSWGMYSWGLNKAICMSAG